MAKENKFEFKRHKGEVPITFFGGFVALPEQQQQQGSDKKDDEKDKDGKKQEKALVGTRWEYS